MKSREKQPSPKKKAKESKALIEMYEAMLSALGPRGWWPADSKLEVCVGAILTQNTAWRNVKRAIANLSEAGCLSVRALADIPEPELARLIVPSGYYNIKAKRLKNFISLVTDEYGGSLNKLFKLPVGDLRNKLLSVNGVGKETADSIILYAAEKPIFVVDAYTKRIGARHGLFSADSEYEAMREFFTERLPEDVKLYNEYHALIVCVGNRYCGRLPDCAACPLGSFLKR